FFYWLEEQMDALYTLDEQALTYAIARCCQIKADVVAQDEKESGIRALLNLGHTFGHAIEAHMGYGNWLHGEAVAAGTVMAAKTALLQGLIDQIQFERIVAILKKAQLPIRTPDSMTFADFMQHMMRDKKVLSGELRLVLPTSIGTSAVVKGVPEAVIEQAIEYCRTV
ncbi:3-dehydroquinate synthase, partial [Vibrio cholerae]|nr:3-dehydroquinate synthase [Vibrio cholerae]